MRDALLLAALGGAILVVGAGRAPVALHPPPGSGQGFSVPTQPLPGLVSPAALTEVVNRYCTRCHNERRLLGNLSLEGFDVTRADENAETAETHDPQAARRHDAAARGPPAAGRHRGRAQPNSWRR